MYPSILKSLTVIALAFSSITSASPIDTPISDLEKRGDWTSKSTCPSGDGHEYDGPSGGAWIVRCNMDTSVPTNTGHTSTDTFIKCIQACGDRPSTCNRVTWDGAVCYFKQKSASDLKSAKGGMVATKLNG